MQNNENKTFILGTVQLGLDYGVNNKNGKPSLDEAFMILDKAYESGVRYLDTAYAYGDSCKIIGEFQKNNLYKSFNILTKIKIDKGLDLAIINIQSMMKELSVDTLECLSFHSFGDYIKYRKDKRILNLLDRGVVNKLGVSIYTSEEAFEISKLGGVSVVQLPFNMLDNKSLKGRALMSLKDNSMEVHARSIFLQGLFFKKKLSTQHTSLKPYFAKMKSIIFQYGMTMEEAAINYVIMCEYIDGILLGVDSKQQLMNNIRYFNNKVEQNFCNEIDDIVVEEIELLNPVNWT